MAVSRLGDPLSDTAEKKNLECCDLMHEMDSERLCRSGIPYPRADGHDIGAATARRNGGRLCESRPPALAARHVYLFVARPKVEAWGGISELDSSV
jgi:hypothetical protein